MSRDGQILFFENVSLGSPEASLYTIKAILVLDNDGERIVAKYYDGEGTFFIYIYY